MGSRSLLLNCEITVSYYDSDVSWILEHLFILYAVNYPERNRWRCGS